MSLLVANCSRCGSKKITFDLFAAIKTAQYHGWQNWYEAFCICRKCNVSTIFVLSESVHGNYKYVHQQGLVKIDGAVNEYVDVEGIISLKDNVEAKPPEHVAENVADIFLEAAMCDSIKCHNAAGSMFRLCIDLATKPLLPQDEIEGLNQKTRRDLGLRLKWLFDNEYLPESLRDLSTCVREDGNDAAHAGNLSENDSAELLDFTQVLLQRIFTEPERLRLAKERRNQRRGTTNS